MREALLQCNEISVNYGGVKALDEASIALREGEIVALIGPNGAGKSTLLKAVFGLAPIQKGEVLWRQKQIIPVSHQMAERGIAFVPQGRRVFAHLTVEENLEIGGFIIKDKAEIKRRIDEVMEFFPVLKQKRKVKAGLLSGGQQQMLALGRGLIIRPKVLFLDEPSLGLAPKIVKEVFEKIKGINKNRETAVLVAEHNIKSVLEIADRGYILDKGKVIVEGISKELLESGKLGKVFFTLK